MQQRKDNSYSKDLLGPIDELRHKRPLDTKKSSKTAPITKNSTESGVNHYGALGPIDELKH